MIVVDFAQRITDGAVADLPGAELIDDTILYYILYLEDLAALTDLLRKAGTPPWLSVR